MNAAGRRGRPPGCHSVSVARSDRIATMPSRARPATAALNGWEFWMITPTSAQITVMPYSGARCRRYWTMTASASASESEISAAIVGESESAWSRYVAGKASPTAGKVHGWLRTLRENGAPLTLTWTADGVTAG